MKKQLLAVLFFIFTTHLFGLDVSVYPAVFYADQQGYVEIHYYFSGQTIGWKSVQDSMMQSSAEVTITFQQNDKIVKFDKYNISSPLLFSASDFRDVHRYNLKPGDYQVIFKIRDNSRSTNNVFFQTKLHITPPKDVQVSDIVLLSAIYKSTESSVFDKYGYHMEALPYNYINKNTRGITIYAEIYNTDKLDPKEYSLRLQFEQNQGGKIYPYQGFTKKRASIDKDIYIKTIDVQFMPTGDYNLSLEVRDNTGKVVHKNTIAFHRDNPRIATTTTIADLNSDKGNFVEKLSTEQLDYHLLALLQMVKGKEHSLLKAHLDAHNLEGKKQFLYRYFIKNNPNSPDIAFAEFSKLVKDVDKAYYDGFGYGFESDRGRIHLRYGLPNDRVKVEDEQFAYPYEIWVYEDLPNLGSGAIKFLFYNKTRAGENFVLLHSNARGERFDRNWKEKLFKDDTLAGFNLLGNNRLDEREKSDTFNDHPNSMAIRYFEQL